MREIIKRALALFLILAMTVSMMPVISFAEEVSEVSLDGSAIADRPEDALQEETEISKDLQDLFLYESDDITEEDLQSLDEEGETDIGSKIPFCCDCIYAAAIPDTYTVVIEAAWFVLGAEENSTATVGFELYDGGELLLTSEKPAEIPEEAGAEISCKFDLAEEDCELTPDTEYSFDVYFTVNGETSRYSKGMTYNEETGEEEETGLAVFWTLPDFEAEIAELEAEEEVGEAELPEDEITDESAENGNLPDTEMEIEETTEPDSSENETVSGPAENGPVQDTETSDNTDWSGENTPVAIPVAFVCGEELTGVQITVYNGEKAVLPNDDGVNLLLPGEYTYTAESESYQETVTGSFCVEAGCSSAEVDLLTGEVKTVLLEAGESKELLSAEIIASGNCGKNGDNVKWTLDSEGLLTISGTGEMDDYSAPSSGTDAPPWIVNKEKINKVIISSGITRIGNWSFPNCSNMDTMEISDGITSIGEGSFYYCSGLSYLLFPESVRNFGDYVCEGCGGLTWVYLPEGITTIEKGTFFNCSKLPTVIIPESVTAIKDYAFQKCSGLTKMELPESIESIGAGSFYGCSELTEINLPNGITSIGNGAFNGCSKLTGIELPDSITSIEPYTFCECNSLTSVIIPSSVTTVGFWSFSSHHLSRIVVPASVVNIEEFAFLGYGMKTAGPIGGDYDFQFGWTETIPENAFSYSPVKSIYLPDSITTIGKYAFQGITWMESIELPASVTSIGWSAFRSCDRLKNIVIPKNVTRIEQSTFACCSELTDIVIPKTVTAIDRDAFFWCHNLSDVYYEGSETDWNNIDINNFDNSNDDLLDAMIHFNYNYNQCGADLTWSFSDGVLTISGSGDMYDYTEKETPWLSITEPIVELIIKDGVTNVGSHAFEGRDDLKILRLPKSIKTIEKSAFANCTSLEQVFFDGSREEWEDVNIKENNEPLEQVCPPYFTSGTCGENLKWIFSGDTLTIGLIDEDNPDGELYDYSDEERPEWYVYKEEIHNLILEEGITGIGTCAFYRLEKLKCVGIPKTLTQIGSDAFGECLSITDIYYYGKEEDWASIEGNEDLISDRINILFNFSAYEFEEDEENHAGIKLTGYTEKESPIIIIPPSVYGKDVYRIDNEAFKECTEIKRIIIPSTVKEIGDRAFYGCRALLNAEFEDKVPSVFGTGIFDGCCKDFAMWRHNNDTEDNENVKYGYAYYKKEDSFDFVYHAFSGTEGQDGQVKVKTQVLWSDDIFYYPVNELNYDLARVSLCMAMASTASPIRTKEGAIVGYNSKGNVSENATRSDRNLRQALESAGFENDYYQYRYSDSRSREDDEAYGMAWKELENGQKVLAVMIRSHGYGGGWSSNADVGTGDYSKGFYESAGNIVYGGTESYKTYKDNGQPEVNKGIKQYLEDNNLSPSDTKIWVMGFSRGGAIANCIGAILQKDGRYTAENDNLVVYSFATPRTVKKGYSWSCNSIFNIVQEMDIVPQVPLQAWGFTRFGTTYSLPCHSISGSDYKNKLFGDNLLGSTQSAFSKLMNEFGRSYQYHPFDGQEQYVDSITAALYAGIRSTDTYSEQMQNLMKDLLFDTMCDKEQLDLTYFISRLYPAPIAGKLIMLLRGESLSFLEKKTLIETLLSTLDPSKPIDNVSISIIILLLEGFITYEFDSYIPDIVSTRGTKLVEYLAGLFTNGFDSKGLMQHWPEEYYAWLNNGYGEANLSTGGYLRYCGKCPVDITVYDSSNRIVAQVINEEIIVDDLLVFVKGDGEKEIYIPEDGYYRVETVSREDNAEMDVAVDRCTFEGEVLKEDIYTEIPLETGEQFAADVAPYDTPAITTDNGATVLTPALTLSGQELYDVGVSVQGAGTVIGNGTYFSGDSVYLSAMPAEGYVFAGWYDESEERISSETEYHFTAIGSRTLTARFGKIPEISFDREYMLFREGDNAEKVTVLLSDTIWNDRIILTTENADSEMTEPVISVEQDGKVTALRAGTAYVVATVNVNGVDYFGRCRVDVTENAVADTVTNACLENTKAMVELYSTDYAKIPVLLEMDQLISAGSSALMSTSLREEKDLPEEEDNGAAIDSARFEDEKTAEVFDLKVVDDRTLEIVPRHEILEADQAKTVKLASSYKSKITVTADGKEYTAKDKEDGKDQLLAITLKKTLPKLSATALKFNSAVPGVESSIVIKGGDVTELEPDTEAAAKAKKPAVPDGMMLSDDGKTISLTEGAPAKGSGKLYLLATVEGWTVKQSVNISYSIVNTPVSLKFKTSTLTLLPGSKDRQSTEYTITPAEYANSERYPLTVTKITETAGGKTVEYENGEELSCVIEDGQITVSSHFTDGKAHTCKVYVSVAGKEFSFTVKTLAKTVKPTMSLKQSGTIEKNLHRSSVSLTITMKNYHAGNGEDYLVEVAKMKGKTFVDEVTDSFRSSVSGNVITLELAENADLIESGYTYMAYVTAYIGMEQGIRASAVKLNIKWTAESKLKPMVTLKASGTLDTLRPETEVKVVPTIKNLYGYDLNSAGFEFFSNGTALGASAPFETEVRDGAIYIQAKEGAVIDAGKKYTVRMTLTSDGIAYVSGGNTMTPTPFTVKMGTAKVTADKKAIELLLKDRYSTGTVKLIPGDAKLCGIDHSRTTLDAASGALFYLKHLGNGEYVIGYKGNAIPSAIKSATTKSVKLNVYFTGNPTAKANVTVPVSVKILK